MASLSLTIEGQPGTIPASVLARVLTDSLFILGDVGKAITRRSASEIEWFVNDLRISSVAIDLASRPTEDIDEPVLTSISTAYVDGLRIMETGESLPPYFSDAALRHLGTMTKPLGRDSGALIAGSSGVESARVTSQTDRNIRKLQAPSSRALGSVTGTLDVISLHRKPRFQVYEDLSNRPVACRFSENELEQIKSALGRRVTVNGVVVRNAKGQPIRVEEPEIRILIDGPPLTRLVGIDPGFTGGMSLSEYMEHVG
jgi:hypothetical protein